MSSQKVENLVVTDAREFTSFDELISALMELHAASDNNPLDRFVSFEMPDGLPVMRWRLEARVPEPCKHSCPPRYVVVISDSK